MSLCPPVLFLGRFSVLWSLMSRNFKALLEAKWAEGKFLCIGLDSDFEKIPESIRQRSTKDTFVAFNRAIIDATKSIAGAYKLNSAFYEAHGDEGWNAMRETIQYILEQAPDVPIILDAKRADIGNTNESYAIAAFDYLHADAITVAPYQGGEALEPFLKRADKGIIVWCRTSNDGAAEFQDLLVSGPSTSLEASEPLYMHVARHVAEKWNTNGNCSLVVGATYPEELAKIRSAVGDMPILIPGVGAQNGDLPKTVQAGKDSKGQGMMINASRAIIFASTGDDYAEAAARKAQELHDAITKAL